MNKLLTTIAVLSVVAAPAFAQGYDPSKNIGETGIYSGVGQQQPAFDAYARAVPHAFGVPQATTNVYDAAGNVIGADPDLNVRMEMRKDDVKNQ